MAIVTLDVTGQILHPDLTPAVGTVTFQIPHDLNDVVDNVTYAPGTFTATLDVAGNFTITGLIATDSPDITETWMYRVHVLTDAYAESFSTSLPAALAPIAEFADLIPAQVEPCTDDGSPCASLAQFADLQAQIDAIGPGGGVQSVNGDAGPIVVLDAADVGADPAGSAAAALIAANAYTDAEIAALPADAVTSVNGQVGVVVLDAGDVGADVAGAAAAAIVTANAYTDGEISTLDAAIQADLALKLNTPNVAVEQVTTWTAADRWVRVNTPYSAGDTNPDLLRFFNGPAGISPTVRLNGNAELRTAPSNDTRNGSRHFEFLDGSNGTFWSVSTNPTNPLLRVDRLHVNGSLEAVRPGWVVASEGVEAPEFLQAGLSLLPSAWTAPNFTASWGSAATISDGAVTGATDTIGTQLIPADKRVWLRGSILNSTGVSAPAQTVFMTIDAAHRPATWKQFPGRTSTNLAVRITVKNTGAVVVDQAITNGATLAFDGINWDMP